MVDLDKLKAIYSLGKNLNFKDIQRFISSATTTSFSSGENLIEVGSAKREIFLIIKGLVRCYTLNDKGDEITTHIMSENQLVASTRILFENKPTEYCFHAIEKTICLSMNYDLLISLISDSNKLERTKSQILLNLLKGSYNRVETFILHTPEERYLNYIKENPDMVNRVPDKYIANILGITPVSLSRIRKRITSS